MESVGVNETEFYTIWLSLDKILLRAVRCFEVYTDSTMIAKGLGNICDLQTCVCLYICMWIFILFGWFRVVGFDLNFTEIIVIYLYIACIGGNCCVFYALHYLPCQNVVCFAFSHHI